jgi:molybdate transport system permease protein
VSSFPSLPEELWVSLGLTLRLAATVTVLLLVIGVALGYWFSISRWSGTIVIETLVNLPVVLPPTVIGFYLLALFAPDQPLGRVWFHITGETLTFNFSGLVVGSILYSLPYAVQPISAAFKSVPGAHVDAAISLGATPFRAFWRITLPLSWRGLTAGAILAFAHTLGEFGVVVMLGGSIPGKTRVASIALYDEVQKLNYPLAHTFAVLLLAISFVLLLLLGWVQGRATRES